MNYNKLVRDRIPEIIAAQGEKPIFRVMDDLEYTVGLEKKLEEEVAEYLESKEIEELADVLEVLYALCEAQGHSVDELRRSTKRSTRNAAVFQSGFFCWEKNKRRRAAASCSLNRISGTVKPQSPFDSK